MLNARDEAAIFQLTNIGANEVITPTTKSRHKYNDPTKSNTSSPSAKMKNWTEKFVKFQRHATKKKTGPAQNLQLTLNNSPISLPKSVSNSSGDTIHIHKSISNNKNFFKDNLDALDGVSLLKSHQKRVVSLPRPKLESQNIPRMKTPGTAPLLRENSTTNSINSKMFPIDKFGSLPEEPNQQKSDDVDDPLAPLFMKAHSPLKSGVDNGNNSNFPWSSKSKRSFVNKSCTLCDELISNKSNGERIIELECQHLCHQECLSVSLNNVSNSVSTNFHSVFPDCLKCMSEKHETRQCIPKSDDLKDRLLSDILIYNSATSPTTVQTIETPINQMYSPLNTPVTQIHTQNFTIPSPLNNIHTQPFLSSGSTSPYNIINDNSSNFPKAIDTRSQMTNIELMKPPFRNRPLNENFNINNSLSNVRGTTRELNRKRQSFMPEPLNFAENQSINEISSLTTSNNRSSEVAQLPLIRSYFIEILLSNFKDTLTDWKIDDEFGLLRLIDTFMISTNSIDYSKCWCFLFENNLITVTINENSNQSDNTTFDTKLKELNIYKIDNNFHMDTLNASTIQCILYNTSKNEEQEIFFTEAMHNDDNMVIQKWISGLLDSELMFNEFAITSTIKIPLIIRNLGRDSNDSETFTGLINSNKIVEVSNFQRNNGSVIIRRALNVGQDIQGKNDPGTLMSLMTSVSSILSLKRDQPENLFVVVQIDFGKIKKETEYNIIFNTVKAISIKFPTAKFSAVDKNGYLLTVGLISADITNVEIIKSWSDISPGSKFGPASIKKKVFSGTLTGNVGVSIISNSNMDNNKSCLLMNFDPFICAGKRRPNELKIKVGYLNADYSDRINELVEVNDWSFVLETICYSFNFGFEKDNFDTESFYRDDRSSFLDFNTYAKSSTTVSDTKSVQSPEVKSLRTLTDDFSNENEGQHLMLENKDSVVDSLVLDLSTNSKTVKDGTSLPIEELQKLIIKSNTESPMYNAVLNKTDDVLQDLGAELEVRNTSVNVTNDALKNDKSLYSYL